MANNLEAKGVTASASDGLTTLANKILTIQASCYHIEFSEDSYVAVGGSATLEISLQENYAPKVGATVTVTGSDSSVYSGITNSSGIASVTVSNVSSETTFTASYSNVSATCTVTVQSVTVYYESALTSDDGKWQKSSSSGMNITYDANGCTVTGTTTSDRTYYINTSSVTIPTSDIVVELDMTGATLGAYNNSTEIVVHNSKLLMESSTLECRLMSDAQDRFSIATSPQFPIHFKFEITSSQIKVYMEGTLVRTLSTSSSYRSIGFKTYNQRGASMKNLKVYELM